ncbi:hypothetical protein HNQ51_001730 [Inhella inkyongensis]|uniref:Uncharacterized protein n=1 Tax=Inhella inkyongensis TaxID=392593 RepID=A0A840S5Y0_9BURK|nr:hypothetical protein [Inhella inkyongensis]MBB5204416.1 hypothetical protein [Inhella inkyongensis]
MKPADLACPVCGTELSPAQLFAEAEAQQAFARLAAVSIPLGARVLQYLTLFTPPKTRLTLAKQCKLLLSLLPDLERQAITAKGRDWHVPVAAWAQAFDQLQASRAAGRLELPLKGHGYLHAVLVGLADKHEARAEAAAEQERRHRPGVQAAPTQAAAPAAAALPTARRDPELLRLEAEARRAVPMPEALRAKFLKSKSEGSPQ